jgi:DNA-binding CsgD family transcriptional regulator
VNLLANDFFKSDKLCVCVKDASGTVLHQNQPCLKLCGDMTSSRCEKGCMLRYVCNPEAPDREEGTQHFPNQLMEDEYFDIFFVNDRNCLTSVLYPLKDKHRANIQRLSGYKLTNREEEIIRLVIRGSTNTQIAEAIFITKGTLKKHLNNIHKKVPSDVFPR